MFIILSSNKNSLQREDTFPPHLEHKPTVLSNEPLVHVAERQDVQIIMTEHQRGCQWILSKLWV
jgi:hypothetical protein